MFDGSVMSVVYPSCEEAHFMFFIMGKICLLQCMLMAILMMSLLRWRVVLKLGTCGRFGFMISSSVSVRLLH